MLVIDLADRLRQANIKVVEHDGWKTRGKPNLSPRVVVCHHTGPGSVGGLIQLCIDGRSDLPGPLANVVLSPDGVAHVIASGTSNNAGAGNWKGISGNASTLSVEAIHPGDQTTPWPQVQLDAYYKICAVMAQMSGFGAETVCGHKEWAPTRKIDPAQLDMGLFRTNVQKILLQMELKPMFDPPLQISAWVKVDYGDGGVVAINAKGEVFCEPASLYIDSPANHPEYFSGHAPAVQVRAVPGGYEITDHHGHNYKYYR